MGRFFFIMSLCLSVIPNGKVTFDEVKDGKGVGHPASFTDYQYGNVVTRTVRNHGGKWCFWRVKSALTVRSGDVFLSLGWIPVTIISSIVATISIIPMAKGIMASTDISILVRCLHQSEDNFNSLNRIS